VNLRYEPAMGVLEQIHFCNEELEVRRSCRVIFADNDIASAIEAETLTKRNMNVERQRPRRCADRRL
jgi:hypothetical protein